MIIRTFKGNNKKGAAPPLSPNGQSELRYCPNRTSLELALLKSIQCPSIYLSHRIYSKMA